ncbi:MAG TPA: sensor histidine kinase, partial [Catenuloplanes sp.]
MTRAAVLDRLRAGIGLLLRPSGPPPRLSRRGRVFDISVALVLFIAAIEEGGGSGDATWQSRDDEPREGQQRGGPGAQDELPRPPPVPVRPFLPIEHDQTGWEVVMLLVVLPLVLRRRFPLAALWMVLGTAPLVTEYNAALRVSFYACVIAAYSAAVYSRYPVPALASLPAAALLYSQLRQETLPTVPDGAVPFLILIPIAVAADALRRWKRRAD